MEVPWLKIPANLSESLPKKRAYTLIEAAYSVALDIYLQKKGTLRGYAALWGWNHHKVKKFLNEFGLLNKAIKNNQFIFQKDTQGFPEDALKINMLPNAISQNTPKSSAKITRTIKEIERQTELCPSECPEALFENWNEIATVSPLSNAKSSNYKNEKNKSLCALPPAKRLPSGDHHTFIAWWCFAYERTQLKPYLTSGKDFKPVKELLAVYGLKPIIVMACHFLTTRDAWLGSKRDIGMFKSQINKIPGPKSQEHDDNVYRSAGIIPPVGTRFENWKFWETPGQ